MKQAEADTGKIGLLVRSGKLCLSDNTHTHTHTEEFQKLGILSDSRNLFSLPCIRDTWVIDGTHQTFPQLPVSHCDTKSSVSRQNKSVSSVYSHKVAA